jgi:hypothetical protein
VQVPVLVASGLLDDSWGLNGGLVAPFVVAVFMMFLGLSSFARALGDDSIWTKAWVVLPLALVVGCLFGWLAQDWAQLTFSNVSFAGNAANICLATVNLVLAVHIRRLAGLAYRNALTWLVIAFASSWIGQFPTPFFEVLDIRESAVLAIPIAVTGALFVKAGYAFNKIREF